MSIHSVASIGPRLGGRGDARPPAPATDAAPSFNWAAARRPRRRCPIGLPNLFLRKSFNWAAARRPRRPGISGADVGQKVGLQLGRGSEAAETEEYAERIKWSEVLQLGRGSEAAETYREQLHKRPKKGLQLDRGSEAAETKIDFTTG